MKSQASFKSHPLHPALIVYPFAFLTGAFGFNLAAAITRNRDLRRVADYLAPTGVASGVVAAIPGIADYVASVPPKSSAKDRAAKHGLLNTGALALFMTSWLLGRGGRRRLVPLLLQGAGSAMLGVAGFMGGTLVYRNQIGVDHRYARAGKWEELTRDTGSARALEFAAASLEVDQMKLVHVGDKRIVVARTAKGYAAFDDRCPHKGGPLSDGALVCGVVQCPWHGSQFDVHTGEVKCGPAEEGIATFPIAQPHRLEHTRA